jgi:drug/metabolite transporter (DMT)-like permease
VTREGDVTSDEAGRATVMLVVVCLLWGLSFPWMKDWQTASAGCPGGGLFAALVMISLRTLLSLVLIGVFQPRLFTDATRSEHLTGAALGAAFSLGFLFQAWGLAHTSPALSAFFTSLSSAWVPLLAWLYFRDAVAPLTLVGLTVGLTGTAVLGVRLDEGGVWLGGGEALTLLASVIFAGQLLMLDRLGRRVRSTRMTVGFFGAAACLALSAALVVAAAGPGVRVSLDWTAVMLSTPATLRNLLCMAALPTALAMHWMNTYQPRVPATRAALIYLLEPVFASFFSVWWEHDALTLPLVFGGGLILAGNLLVELPRWLLRVTPPSTSEKQVASPTGGSLP